jgi:ABC-type sulfate/molybdate transport systems ATPase subunit
MMANTGLWLFEEVLKVADRVVLKNQGKVEQTGSPQQVWDHTVSPFVYGFLSDVNLLHGRAHEAQVQLEGIRMASPEHASGKTPKILPTSGRTTWTCTSTHPRRRDARA